MTADHDGREDARAEAAALFRENLGLIERVIGRICRNAHLPDADAEDFASSVRLALIENDYAVLRAWQRRASLASYLTIVVQRLLLDERMRARGRFEPSAEARRAGAAAVLLETLVRRDGRPVEEAIPLVQAVDPSLGRGEIAALLARLPDRHRRPRPAPIDGNDFESHRASDAAEATLLEREAARLSVEASRIVQRALEALPQEDRTIVRMHFGSGTSIADIARMLRLPQRPLYRRLEAALAHLRRALVAAGIDAGTAAGLIGSAVEALDFGLLEWKNDTGSQSSHDEVEGPENAGAP
jgi:RNA polymerase sigma factor for flagellar operon FliA